MNKFCFKTEQKRQFRLEGLKKILQLLYIL